MLKRLSLALVVALLPTTAWPQTTPFNIDSVIALTRHAWELRTANNVVYSRANGWEGRLDVYAQRSQTPTPTVIFFHLGGWTSSNKERSVFTLLPWMAMGYSVVNVEYRIKDESPAPAAIEDGRCALRWVFANAEEYGFDTERIITTGESAGGHLALMTGMVPISAGFDNHCLTAAEPKVAGIVNFFGITDVADLLGGPNKDPFPWPISRPYAVQWIGNRPDRMEIAKAASPLTYVRAGLPPIISVQGDMDPIVPYSHSVRLHEALQKVGVANELVTVPKAVHGPFRGAFPLAEWQRAFARIQAFLNANGVGIAKAPPSAGNGG